MQPKFIAVVVCGILLLSILLWCPWSIPRVEDQECGTRTIPRIEIFACIYGYQKNAYIINICIYTCIIYYIYIYLYIHTSVILCRAWKVQVRVHGAPCVLPFSSLFPQKSPHPAVAGRWWQSSLLGSQAPSRHQAAEPYDVMRGFPPKKQRQHDDSTRIASPVRIKIVILVNYIRTLRSLISEIESNSMNPKIVIHRQIVCKNHCFAGRWMAH